MPCPYPRHHLWGELAPCPAEALPPPRHPWLSSSSCVPPAPLSPPSPPPNSSASAGFVSPGARHHHNCDPQPSPCPRRSFSGTQMSLSSGKNGSFMRLKERDCDKGASPGLGFVILARSLCKFSAAAAANGLHSCSSKRISGTLFCQPKPRVLMGSVGFGQRDRYPASRRGLFRFAESPKTSPCLLSPPCSILADRAGAPRAAGAHRSLFLGETLVFCPNLPRAGTGGCVAPGRAGMRGNGAG